MLLIRSFGYALAGVKYCYVKEINFRIHLFFTAIVIIAGISLTISLLDWIIVIGCIGTVLSLEMLNSAIEKLCDVVSIERKPQIKVIKDIAAGAVLVVAILSSCIGVIIFLPKILNLVK
jgi:diacylglycerol kinase